MVNTTYMGKTGKEETDFLYKDYKAGKISYENLTGRSLGDFLSPFFHALHPENQNLPLPFNLYIRN